MSEKIFSLIDRLANGKQLSGSELMEVIAGYSPDTAAYLFARSRAVSQQHFGKRIYIRGLIEFTNYCKNDCFYCGIRKSNFAASRYRLTEDQILSCCDAGYELGFRTFVLQGGEDGYYSDERMVNIVRAIRTAYSDCAITLSLGERSYDSYQRFFEAGANRYLLRQETADASHYRRLHPKGMSLENRKRCLYDLKRIGYQVGAGFLVGSPYQKQENIVKDLLFLRELQPQMIGIGPFIPHSETPFCNEPAGSLALTIYLIGILRLMFPKALIPSTTAVGTLDPQGREKAILAGANVLMPNLSPLDVRKNYLLYDNKICTGEEAAESCRLLRERIGRIGYEIVVDRGDYMP